MLSVVRGVVLILCVVGIVGMILGSVNDNNNGVVITFGLVTAVAVVLLMAVTAAARSAARANVVDETLAARVEDEVTALVAAGADESEVRRLVGDAVRLGRGR